MLPSGKKMQASMKEAQTGRGTFHGGDEEFMRALKDDFAKPKTKPGRKPK